MRKKILCLGDSNTWGHIPNTKNSRYNKNIRWASKLNNTFDVVEFGLDGMTLFCKNAPEEKIGLNKLENILLSNQIFDYIIIQLGLNDLLAKYHKSTQSLKLSYKKLLNIVNFYNKTVHYSTLFIIKPHYVNENADFAKISKQYKGINKKIKKINKYLEKFNKKTNVKTIDTSNITVGLDGIHFTKQSHNLLYLHILDALKECEK